MPDYQRGKIYKITSGDLTYIGSTCEPTLAKRLANHKKGYKRWKAGKEHRVTSFTLIETGDYEITLIELCPCGSKDELSARERFYIENTICVNKTTPGRTKQEWLDDHPDYMKDYRKEWYEKNKIETLQKSKEWYEANKERKYAKHKEWVKANPDKVKAIRERHEVKKSHSTVT